MEKFFYVRKDATLANDDDNVNGSNLFPVSAFSGAEATADGTLVLYFKQRINWQLPNDSATTEGKSDTLSLTIGNNKHKDVLQSITTALAGKVKKYKDTAFIVIFDAVTGEKIDSNITAVTPAIAAANA
jgi:hypothetical protein